MHNNESMKRPSIGLIMDCLSGSFEEKTFAEGYFIPEALFFKYRLLEFVKDANKGMPFLSRQVKINERIYQYLFGSDFIV